MNRILIALVVVASLAGCTVDSDKDDMTPTPTSTATPPAASEATFVATQSAPPGPGVNVTYGFDGPERVAAGWVTLHLQNQGAELHQLVLMDLGDMSYDDYAAAMGATMMGGSTMGGMTPATPTTMGGHMGSATPVGGVAAVTPGTNGTAIVRLDAGTYALLCQIPGGDGMAHMKHGMMRKLVVVAPQGAPASEPSGDITITASDYHFNLSKPLTAGAHTLKFENKGTHHHEAVLIKLTGNATAKDFTDYFAPDNHPTGPPPADAAWGAGTLATGAHEYVTADLPAGHYGLFCFEQDNADSPPHFVLGMVREFDVS